jgi:hypothetical protein
LCLLGYFYLLQSKVRLTLQAFPHLLTDFVHFSYRIYENISKYIHCSVCFVFIFTFPKISVVKLPEVFKIRFCHRYKKGTKQNFVLVIRSVCCCKNKIIWNFSITTTIRYEYSPNDRSNLKFRPN